MEDPVYQGFIRPEYQAERKGADRAEHRFFLERQQRYQIEKLLTQKQQRAEQADQRADQAEQHLRQESQRADQATATILTLLRQSLAHRFNLPLD